MAPGGEPVTVDEERRMQQWTAFANLVIAYPDVLTGVRWDAATSEMVVLTVDAAATGPLVADAALGGVAFRVEVVTRSYNDLVALSALLIPTAHTAKLAHSGGARMDGRIGINLAVRDGTSVDAIAAIAGADADVVCVRGGADPATVVADGPQPVSGDGWRLLTEPITIHTAAAPISIAATPRDYETLWAALTLPAPPVPADFDDEIVLAVVNGESPGCENRLDQVTFDTDHHRVRLGFVLPGGNRGCRTMASSRAYLLAVPRSRLPTLPFQIVNRGDQCDNTCTGDPLDVVAF